MRPAAARERIEPRTRAMTRASLRDDLGVRDICVIDISTRGMLATSANPPSQGAIVELQIGCNILTAQVRWTSQRRFGLSLRERISVTALLEGGGRPARLQRSAVEARRGSGVIAGLCAHPQMLARVGQLLTFGVVAASAGYLIMTFMSEGLAPVQEAMAAMNTAGPV